MQVHLVSQQSSGQEIMCFSVVMSFLYDVTCKSKQGHLPEKSEQYLIFPFFLCSTNQCKLFSFHIAYIRGAISEVPVEKEGCLIHLQLSYF